MTVFQRVAVTLLAVSLCGAVVGALTYTGARAEGPIDWLMGGVGGTVSTVESRVVHRLRGPGRSAELAWFAPYRESTDRLRHPEHVLLGAYDSRLPTSLDGVWALEDALGMRLPLVHLFTAWGDRPDQQFPARTVQAIANVGSVPVVTWEPWLKAFREGRGLPPAGERDDGGLAAVASGAYDFYLERWARAAAAHGGPLFVRLGHEMNDAYRYPWGPHNNRAEDYVAMFRHVVEVFRREGADNVLWVWTPHVAYDFAAYYPGDDVVDWVGTTALNYGTVAYWSQWWTFEEVFERHYDALRAYGKPIMIAELGTIRAGGERAPWLAEALTDLPDRLPEVKAVVFFHNDSDDTITYQALNWAFAADSTVANAVRQALTPWARSHR